MRVVRSTVVAGGGRSPLSFGKIGRMKNGLVVFTIVVAALVAAGLPASRPPALWRHVALGMSRSNVYSLVGAPVINNESTKSGVRWRRDAVVGRWEFEGFFRADDTVGSFGERWRWNWW